MEYKWSHLDNASWDKIGNQINILMPNMCYFFWVVGRWSPASPKSLPIDWPSSQLPSMAVSLGYPPALDGKTPIIKKPYIWVIGYEETKLTLTWKLYLFLLTNFWCAGRYCVCYQQSQVINSRPASNLGNYNNKCPDKMCSLMQQWHETCNIKPARHPAWIGGREAQKAPPAAEDSLATDGCWG